jgi:hypothetical protein
MVDAQDLRCPLRRDHRPPPPSRSVLCAFSRSATSSATPIPKPHQALPLSTAPRAAIGASIPAPSNLALLHSPRRRRQVPGPTIPAPALLESSICVDLLLVQEGNRVRPLLLGESLMRHFLPLARPVLALALGVAQPPAKPPLISRAGAAHALDTRLPRAPPPAIPLSLVAAPAHPHLLPTALAVEYTIGFNADPHVPQPSPKAGQRAHLPSWSPVGRASITRSPRCSRRLESVVSGLHLFGAASSRISAAAASRPKYSKKREANP